MNKKNSQFTVICNPHQSLSFLLCCASAPRTGPTLKVMRNIFMQKNPQWGIKIDFFLINKSYPSPVLMKHFEFFVLPSKMQHMQACVHLNMMCEGQLCIHKYTKIAPQKFFTKKIIKIIKSKTVLGSRENF
jgi:hypothetical protein